MSAADATSQRSGEPESAAQPRPSDVLSTRGTLFARLDSVSAVVLGVGALVFVGVFELLHLTGYAYSPSPGTYSAWGYDEGVYAETGILMSHSVQLYSKIYSAQPPLLPLALSLGDRVMGDGLAQARIIVLLFGLLALVGVAAVAGLCRGWWAAGASAAVLGLAPQFLIYSHAIEEEIPMAGLSAISLALALAWYRWRKPSLAGAAGLLFGLALLTKFLAVAVLAPEGVIAILIVWAERSRWLPVARDVVLFVVAAAIPVVVTLAVWGQAEWNQMVGDRLGATADQAQIQQGSSMHLFREFLFADPTLTILAGLAAVALLLVDWRMGLILDAWLGATTLILLTYHPLFGHHLEVLLAPLAAVAGAGISCLSWPARNGREGSRRVGGVPLAQRIWDAARTRSGLAVQLATIGLVVWAAFLPFRIFSFDRVFLGSGPGDRQLAVVADVVRHYTSPNQEVVTGDPMLCVLAARPCVSEMVDTSYVRVQTGKLTNALGYTESANVPVAVMGRALCLDPYMAGYDRWIMAHFRLVMQARIESDIDCPWRSDGTAVRPRGHSGVYVRGISREQ